jgi:dTDP-4-amino-4,6-dideoxygalactose transaminase
MTDISSPELREVPEVGPVPWVRPDFEVDGALLAQIQGALVAGRVTNGGPLVQEFERCLAAYLGVEDCVAVSSGSAALLLAVQALGIPGAKAMLPSFTFIATLNALVHAGITPVFCDIEPDTWTLSPAHLARLLGADRDIRLVVGVNVFGVPPDLTSLGRAADAAGAALMLDNAHGMGTRAEGRPCAVEPKVQTYSFHATKTLPAVEGGAVVSADPRLLAEVRRLRNHGLAADPRASSPGFNAKMSELHAAIGLRSLRALDAAVERRRAYAERLRRTILDDCSGLFAVQRIPASVHSNFQNLGVLCRLAKAGDAARVQSKLAEAGIETRRYFWPPLHCLDGCRGPDELPVTDEVARTILCLPLHSRMEPAALERVESALRSAALELGAEDLGSGPCRS